MSSDSKLLALETSTNVCSVCFRNESGEIFEERSEGRGVHSEILFLSIKKLMDEHTFTIDDLNGIIVSAGPGSYTGLRIAASGVKGLLFNSETKLYSAETLASYAVSAISKVAPGLKTHAVIDARRTHLYHQTLHLVDDRLMALSEVEVKDLTEINELIEEGDVIIGTGIERLDSDLVESASTFGMEEISAKSLIHLYDLDGEFEFVKKEDVLDFEPNYYTSNQVNNSISKPS